MPSRRRFLGRDHLVDFRERADQRLFARDLFAGCECRQYLAEMERRWSADVDDVDIIQPQHFFERLGTPRDREFLADARQSRRVDIAQCLKAKFIGVLAIPLRDMVAADAASDNRDPPDPRFRHAGPAVFAVIYRKISAADHVSPQESSIYGRWRHEKTAENSEITAGAGADAPSGGKAQGPESTFVILLR